MGIVPLLGPGRCCTQVKEGVFLTSLEQTLLLSRVQAKADLWKALANPSINVGQQMAEGWFQGILLHSRLWLPIICPLGMLVSSQPAAEINPEAVRRI